MMQRLALLFWVLFLLLPGIDCFSQTSDFRFENITEKNGLSYNIVNCFLKDSKGFLWIGTYDGLNRYDGNHFYIYKQSKDTQSLIHNTVHGLSEARNGDIWGCTDDGIFRYSFATNNFKNYRSRKYKSLGVTLSILCDKQGDVWASGFGGLFRFDSKADSFRLYRPDSNNVFSFSGRSVAKNGLLESPSGNGFFIAGDKGLNFYEYKTGHFLNHINTQTDSVIFNKNNISALSVSPAGRIWFFDNHRKAIVGANPISFTHKYDIDSRKFLSEAWLANIFEDSRKKLWLSNWYDNKVTLLDYTNGMQVDSLFHDKKNPSSIAGDFFWAAREEKDGSVWLGTLGGISVYNPSRLFYKIHPLAEKVPELPNRFPINFFSENKVDKSWWIASSNGAVVHYFPLTGKHNLIPVSAFPANDRGKKPVAFFRISNIGNTTYFHSWEGTWQTVGLSEKIIPCTITGKEYSDFLILDMEQVEDSIYMISDGKKLLRYNALNQSKRIISFPTDTSVTGRKRRSYYLAYKPGFPLWMVSNDATLASVESDASFINPVPLDMDGLQYGSGYFHSLDIDAEGRVWLARKGQGLFCYNPASKKLQNWRESDGLCFDHIMTSSVDRKGRIWCVGYNKVSVFVPASGSFYSFSIPLSSNNYSYVNVMSQLSNGNILVNIGGDLVEFFPDRINVGAVDSRPLISEIIISGKSRIISGETTIKLEPDENFINFRFGMINNSAIIPYQFEYKLDGINEKWVQAGNNSEAAYTNLPPGKYTFRLVAAESQSKWRSKETTIEIIIRTPFYQTAWFFIMIASLLAGLLIFIYRYRIAQQKKYFDLQSKTQLLEKEKALVMYEGLKQQLNPHFLFNSLTSLASLISTNPSVARGFLDNLSKTYRYILKSRDSETVALGDEIKFAQNYVQLQRTRFETGLEVDFNVDERFYHMKIVPVTLQNLIENAIKHNIIDDESPLHIDIFTDHNYLVVKNNLQKKNFVETSNKQGLVNLKSLYQYLSERPVQIEEDEAFFAIRIPLI